MDADQLAKLIALIPEYGLLFILGVGYRWLHREHRAERTEWLAAIKERDDRFIEELQRLDENRTPPNCPMKR